MKRPKDDCILYGKASAARYLGVSEVWIEQLVKRGELLPWQERPPDVLPDGRKTRGSDYVFTQAMLDAYQAAPRRKPGWPKGKPRKPRAKPPVG